MPDTHPTVKFKKIDEDTVKVWGIERFPGCKIGEYLCFGCINYAKRKYIDWELRKRELRDLCDRHAATRPYNCLIAVSGGKDSYFLVKTMVEDYQMRPLLVTVTDPFTHTEAGQQNLTNLVERYNLNHLTYRISPDLFKRATRAAFEAHGEPLKFIEYAIYSVPVMLAQQLDIGLVVFGENSAYEYGSTDRNTWKYNIWDTIGKKMASEKTWWNSRGIPDEELWSIAPAHDIRPDIMFMSYFYPWSSLTNIEAAKERGFVDLDDTKEWDRQGTIEQFEQIDSIGYMVHLWMKYPKFGFQRVTDVVTRRIREGSMTLEEGQKLIEEHDPVLDPKAMEDFCRVCGYTEKEFDEVVKKHERVG